MTLPPQTNLVYTPAIGCLFSLAHLLFLARILGQGSCGMALARSLSMLRLEADIAEVISTSVAVYFGGLVCEQKY